MVRPPDCIRPYNYQSASHHDPRYSHHVALQMDDLSKAQRRQKLWDSAKFALETAFRNAAECGNQFNYVIHSEEDSIEEVINQVTIRPSARNRAVIVPAAAGPEILGPSMIMVDSGCPFDLIGEHDVPPEILERNERLDDPIELDRANGPVSCWYVVPMQCSALQEDIYPLLRPDSPAVISMGSRCMKHGYGCYWEPYRPPYFITPNGKRVECIVINDVPYVDETGDLAQRIRSAPAVRPKAKAAADRGRQAAPPPDNSGDEADDESEQEEPYVPPIDASDPARLTPANRKLMLEAMSHCHLMCHKPKNPFCPHVSRQKHKESHATGELPTWDPVPRAGANS